MQLDKRLGVTTYAAKSGRKRRLKAYNYIAEAELIGKPFIIMAYPLLVTQNIIRWEFCFEQKDTRLYDPTSVEVGIHKDATAAEVALLCIDELRSPILDRIMYLEELYEDLLTLKPKEFIAGCPEAFTVCKKRTGES